MDSSEENKNYWLVGHTYGGSSDQSKRFIKDNIWEHGFKDDYTDEVNLMRAGERIALKATYTRKHDLPFNNNGHHVSCMSIRAIGTISENLGDGHKIGGRLAGSI